jgi:hypothetical protein
MKCVEREGFRSKKEKRERREDREKRGRIERKKRELYGGKVLWHGILRDS